MDSYGLWCVVIEQNVQPPKQSLRMIVTEFFNFISNRGDRLGVRRVRPTGVRQVVDAVHVGLRQRQAGRIDDYGFTVVELHERLGVVRIRVDVNDARVASANVGLSAFTAS